MWDCCSTSLPLEMCQEFQHPDIHSIFYRNFKLPNIVFIVTFFPFADIPKWKIDSSTPPANYSFQGACGLGSWASAKQLLGRGFQPTARLDSFPYLYLPFSPTASANPLLWILDSPPQHGTLGMRSRFRPR